MYTIGKQRLFYVSQTSGNKLVEAEIISPTLTEYGPFEMTWLTDDTFYIDIIFRTSGSYVFKVFENSTQVHRDILRITRGRYVVYPQPGDIEIF
jgi:hypothetical protein